MQLPVILPARPRLLLVGINPGLESGAQGHHFARKGNPFWRLLHASGLTPELLAPAEEARLAEFGIGLVNLCDRTTRTAAELTRDELEKGRKRLGRRVARIQPEVVALVGVTMFPVVFPKSPSKGPGLKSERLGEARVYVLPNPSGLNASFPGFDSKLVWFQDLRKQLSPLR